VGVAVVVDVEELRSQRVAAVVALALLGVDPYSQRRTPGLFGGATVGARGADILRRRGSRH